MRVSGSGNAIEAGLVICLRHERRGEIFETEQAF